MAGDEDEPEEIIADRVVQSGVEIGRGLFEGFEFAGKLFVFALGDGVAAEQIDGASFGGGGKPCPRVVGDAGSRPLFERSEKRLLRKIFRQAHVARQAGESGDDPRGLDAPDGFNGSMQGLICGLMRIVIWIGSGHCYRSHQLPIP